MRVEILMPAPGAFVLGRSRFGDPLTGAAGEWVDIMPRATRVVAVRGGTTPQLNQLDVGTLTVDLVDVDPAADPRLRFGRRVRLIDETAEDGEQVHWIGRIQDVTAREIKPTARHREGRIVTMLHAVDVVSRLAGTLAGAGHRQGETLSQRVSAINARVAADVEFTGTDTAAVLAATGVNATAAEHLNMACDSLPGAAWRPTREDTIEVRRQWLTDPKLAFLDRDGGAYPSAYTFPSTTLHPGEASA